MYVRILILICIVFTTFGHTTQTERKPVLLVFGDSLSAGYGINPQNGWVALLQKRLKNRYQVINDSISGDTSSNGLQRFKPSLDRFHPSIVIIELGGNDGLRGISLKTSYNNLAKMIELAKKRNIKVLLLGVRLPPNYGSEYTDAFKNNFQTLSKQYNVTLVPAFLKKVAENDELMQPDGIHPTEAAQQQLLNNVWPALLPLLKDKQHAPIS